MNVQVLQPVRFGRANVELSEKMQETLQHLLNPPQNPFEQHLDRALQGDMSAIDDVIADRVELAIQSTQEDMAQAKEQMAKLETQLLEKQAALQAESPSGLLVPTQADPAAVKQELAVLSTQLQQGIAYLQQSFLGLHQAITTLIQEEVSSIPMLQKVRAVLDRYKDFYPKDPNLAGDLASTLVRQVNRIYMSDPQALAQAKANASGDSPEKEYRPGVYL